MKLAMREAKSLSSPWPKNLSVAWLKWWNGTSEIVYMQYGWLFHVTFHVDPGTAENGPNKIWGNNMNECFINLFELYLIGY